MGWRNRAEKYFALTLAGLNMCEDSLRFCVLGVRALCWQQLVSLPARATVFHETRVCTKWMNFRNWIIIRIIIYAVDLSVYSTNLEPLDHLKNINTHITVFVLLILLLLLRN